MNSDKFIKELEFTLNTNSYKYEYGEIMYKNKFGHWCGLFNLTIDTDDKEFLASCCRYCVQAFYCGTWHGKHERSRELRELLEIGE